MVAMVWMCISLMANDSGHLFMCSLAVCIFSDHLFFVFVLFYSFICLWLRWVFVAVRGLSLVAASRGYYSLRCAGFSLRWLLLWWSTGSRHVGFSSCGARAQ